MQVTTCKACGKIFNYVQGDRLCPQCIKKMDEKFVDVKKFVRDNPKSAFALQMIPRSALIARAAEPR